MPPGTHVSVHEKEWISADLKNWAWVVWDQHPRSLLCKRVTLVLDSFMVIWLSQLNDTCTTKIQFLLNSWWTDLITTSGCVHKQTIQWPSTIQWQTIQRHFYGDWMACGSHSLTPGGNIKKPSVEILCVHTKLWMIAFRSKQGTINNYYNVNFHTFCP